MLRIFSLTTLMVFAIACSQARWDDPGPRETFENFLIAESQGDIETVFAMIWKEDREVLKARADALEGVPESVRPAAHEMLVIAGMDHPYDIERTRLAKKIESEPETGQQVVVELFYMDGREGKATMIWGGDGWYVDLPLEPERLEEDTDDSFGRPERRNPDRGSEAGQGGPKYGTRCLRSERAAVAGSLARDRGRRRWTIRSQSLSGFFRRGDQLPLCRSAEWR